MDRDTWRATAHGVRDRHDQATNFHFQFSRQTMVFSYKVKLRYRLLLCQCNRPEYILYSTGFVSW